MMIRYAYLFPRIVIIGLIALAVWASADPLIKSVVIHKLQNATGAKVEIGQMRTSLVNQKIFLKDVAIADARAPMNNLLQAEMAYVELDPQSLLQRRVVVEHSQTSQIVFGAPRTDSGALEGFPVGRATVDSTWDPKPFAPVDQIGLKWIDQFKPIESDLPSIENLELTRQADKQNEFWIGELESQLKTILAMREKTAKLKSLAGNYIDNPLRPKFINAGTEVNTLALRTQAIKNRLFELGELATADRENLQRAHHRDTEKLRQSIQVASFDSDSISRLLLTRSQEERVAEIISWFDWFRSAIPDPGADFQPKQKRGVDIRIPGVKPGPGFLIKSIDLEGEGRFANRHINFAGSAYDLTSQPALHDRPASFELRAQGDQHFTVTCTLDRRGEQPIDRLKVLCPDAEFPAQVLGEENSMMVTMGPASRIQADIQIEANGDQLIGELVFHHSNVALHVDKLHEILGGADTVLQMNQGLGAIKRFETRITISGTPNDYQYEFQSDLGSRFSNAVNTLLVENNEKTIASRKLELDQLLSNQLKRLDNEILPQLQKLVQLLNAESVEIASLRDAIPTRGNSRLPNMR